MIRTKADLDYSQSIIEAAFKDYRAKLSDGRPTQASKDQFATLKELLNDLQADQIRYKRFNDYKAGFNNGEANPLPDHLIEDQFNLHINQNND